MLKIDDLIGVPYKEHGRTKEDGFDCYGLIIEISKRLNKPLPDVFYENHNLELADENAPLLPIQETSEIKEGVLLEMEIDGELHIGFAINSKEMIHATKRGVRINRIGTFPIRKIYKWL